MADCINFVRVSKKYANGVLALDDVTFSVADGEFVFVIGESGAGKSTIIKLLTREEKVTRGRILVNNFDITALYEKHVPYMRRKVGMIYQDFRLIETKTVYENVAFAMEIVGTPPQQIARRVPVVLSLVGLGPKAHMYPNQLSGGEAQRAGIARAVVNTPKILLADEPTGNLDPANSTAIMNLLNRISREGTTVLCCTHDHTSVRSMNERILEFQEGRLIGDSGGDLSRLRPQAKTPVEDESNSDLERMLDRQPPRQSEVVTASASTVQADIERILSRLPRRPEEAGKLTEETENQAEKEGDA